MNQNASCKTQDNANRENIEAASRVLLEDQTSNQREMIANGVSYLFSPGDLVETRVKLKEGWWRGLYFDDHDRMAQVVQRLDQDERVQAVYYVINHCKPNLLKQRQKCDCKICSQGGGLLVKNPTDSQVEEILTGPSQHLTSNEDIDDLCWLFIDIDTVRAQGFEHESATKEEKAASRVVAGKVIQYLDEKQWPQPLLGDSGNGFHILPKLQMLNTVHNIHLLVDCLKALAEKFNCPAANIDCAVFNPARLTRAYGTTTRKGMNAEERPYRRNRLLEPKNLITEVSLEQILVLGDDAPKDKSYSPEGMPEVLPEFDPEDFFQWYEKQGAFTIEGERETSGMQIMVTDVCLNAGRKHTGSGLTGFIVGDSFGYHCFSSDCEGVTIGTILRKLNESGFTPYPHRIFVGESMEDVLDTFGAEQIVDSPAESLSDRLLAAIQAEEKREHESISGLYGFYKEDDELGSSTLMVIRAADIVAEKQEWLWLGKIPGGSATLFAGQPGCGKSTVLIDIIARTTTGRDWPDGVKNTAGQKDVLFAVSEDDIARTVKPRLMAAGADMSRVHFIRGVKMEVKEGKSTSYTSFQLDSNLTLLKDSLKAHPDVALVAFDPISAFFGNADPNKDKEIRPVMERINKACEKTAAAFVAIIHHNKRSDADSISKILGGSSVIGVARAAWSFSKNPDNPDERVMGHVKGNLSKSTSGMKYRIVEKEIDLPSGEKTSMSCIEWLEETKDTANDIMEKQREATKNPVDRQLEAAKGLLRTLLENGPMRSPEVYDKAKAEGISDSTVKRALKALGGQHHDLRKSGRGSWWMSLPGFDKFPEPKTEQLLPDVEALYKSPELLNC